MRKENTMKYFEKYEIITKEELNAMFEEEERTGIEFLKWGYAKEFEDGRMYTRYTDKRTGKKFAVWEPRTVHFGLNSIPEEKVQELVEIVEREGGAQASWSCTGRTLHQMLANRLASMLPQYSFDIDYNYRCNVSKA